MSRPPGFERRITPFKKQQGLILPQVFDEIHRYNKFDFIGELGQVIEDILTANREPDLRGNTHLLRADVHSGDSGVALVFEKLKKPPIAASTF
jgi:hypothetical protein